MNLVEHPIEFCFGGFSAEDQTTRKLATASTPVATLKLNPDPVPFRTSGSRFEFGPFWP